MRATTEYRYNRLTWAEMNDAVTAQQVVLLPTGSTEQHGRHLPLDVDVFLAESVCHEAGRRAPDRLLVMPPIPYGLNLHHIDFPGTVHVEPQTYIDYLVNVTKSVAYHGFEKILIVNGHGSNTPTNDLVARRTTLETNSLCASVNYFALALEAFESVRDTEVIAHADEFETSLYLALAPDRVQMDHAADGDDRMGKYMSSDSLSKYPVRFSDYWGRWTGHGVHGDPTTATAAKGQIILEAAVNGILGLVDEFKSWPIAARKSQHVNPIQSDIRW